MEALKARPLKYEIEVCTGALPPIQMPVANSGQTLIEIE